MIVVSILLVTIAAGLLVGGLVQGSSGLFYGSIVVSVVAALALISGVRQWSGAAVVDDEAHPLPDRVPAEPISTADAARIADLAAGVMVASGGQRHYHLRGCPSIHAQPARSLPVSTAAALGFSPCGRCKPVTALLTGPYLD